MVDKLLPLTRLPEWSDFFLAAYRGAKVNFVWREERFEWVCRAYDFSHDLARPIEVVMLSEARRDDMFDALAGALETCGREIGETTWRAFHAFRFAATGIAANIEDLL